jgi:phosphoglycerol transferase MdoB-like AlkP superfamily enzyme
MKKLLAFAGIAEAATGAALVIVPSLVGQLLFGEELAGISIAIARVTGIALIGLGIACWPGPAQLGILVYSTLAALFLAYLALSSDWVGPLLWPAILVHSVLTCLLIVYWFKAT